MTSIVTQIDGGTSWIHPSLEDGKNIFIPNGSAPVGDTSLSVEFLTYIVKEKRGSWWKGKCFQAGRSRTVLDNINLVLKSGQMTAILGGSGSGKTSLLDTISYRHEGAVFGKICYNNKPTTRETMNQHSSYVIQADRLLPNLTVRETLTYTARLRLGGKFSFKEIKAKVHKVILEMGLKHVADTRVGAAINRGISGGERRRVTIAIQLLKDPNILLLDEPTTGLDSYTAKYLIRNLADLAHKGKIVLITIHQPCSDLFTVFDQIVLLSEGRQVFCGPSDKMLDYFAKLEHPCPKYANPMDIYVDLGTVDMRNKNVELESRSRVDALVDNFNKSDLNALTINSFGTRSRSAVDTASLDDGYFSRNRPTAGPFRTMTTLVTRMTLNLYQDKRDFIWKALILPLYIVFIVAFLGHLRSDQTGIQDRTGLLYQTVAVPAYCSVLTVVQLVPSLRDLFYRESRDGLYGAGMFVMSYAVHSFPFNIVSTGLFAISVYWICGMNPELDRFFVFAAVMLLMYTVFELVTLALMGAFNNPLIVAAVCNCLITTSLLFSSGFLRVVGSMLDEIQVVNWVIVHKYASEIVAANEFHGLNFTCTPDQECVFKDGDAYLDAFYPDALDNMTRNYYVLGGFLLAALFCPVFLFKVRGIPHLR